MWHSSEGDRRRAAGGRASGERQEQLWPCPTSVVSAGFFFRWHGRKKLGYGQGWVSKNFVKIKKEDKIGEELSDRKALQNMKAFRLKFLTSQKNTWKQKNRAWESRNMCSSAQFGEAGAARAQAQLSRHRTAAALTSPSPGRDGGASGRTRAGWKRCAGSDEWGESKRTALWTPRSLRREGRRCSRQGFPLQPPEDTLVRQVCPEDPGLWKSHSGAGQCGAGGSSREGLLWTGHPPSAAWDGGDRWRNQEWRTGKRGKKGAGSSF